MDLASIIGIVGGFVLIIFGIVAGNGISALGNFIDVNSVIITIGGTLSAILTMSGNPKEFLAGLKSIGLIMKPITQDEAGTIKEIIELSNMARKEGLLALEEGASNIEDDFLKKGILLIVDGTDPELVRSILETEISCIEDRHKKRISYWDNVASMGPAWGMIGTLIGLVNMLAKLDDPSSIGPAMAVALITTLYGSMIANWIATPAAKKLAENNSIEIRLKEVMVEGLLSIQAGENPRVIEEKLKSFLAPADRGSISEGDGENG